MFQIATTCAHAWDHGAEPYFPDVANKKKDGMPLNFAHVFFRLNTKNPGKPSFIWNPLPSSNYSSSTIPYHPNMQLGLGAYQSEKYFKHHREKIVSLFAPHPDDLAYINEKYAHILEHPMTVGVQMRYFGNKEDLIWVDHLVQYGYDYFDKAMANFPEETLFVISFNNPYFALVNLPLEGKNFIFLQNEPYYIDFFILSMCKHNIISNSTFGWWAAWLNQNEEKIVIAPELWIDPKCYSVTPVTDVYPDEWLRISAKWGKPNEPIDSFR